MGIQRPLKTEFAGRVGYTGIFPVVPHPETNENGISERSTRRLRRNGHRTSMPGSHARRGKGYGDRAYAGHSRLRPRHRRVADAKRYAIGGSTSRLLSRCLTSIDVVSPSDSAGEVFPTRFWRPGVHLDARARIIPSITIRRNSWFRRTLPVEVVVLAETALFEMPPPRAATPCSNPVQQPRAANGDSSFASP